MTIPIGGPSRRSSTPFNSKIPLDWAQPDQSAQKILDTLKAGSRMFRDHPEIENLGVVLFGFSAGAAGAARTASSRLLSDTDASAPPQRVLAVIDLNELDQAPYMAPPSTPQLFLSDSGDIFGGLSTDVEDSDPKITHEALAHRLAASGVPLTVISQPGHFHGGSVHGYHNKVDYRFLRVWLAEVLKLRLPRNPPKDAPAVAPDWRGHAGWLGTYDVATGASTQPWGDGERMINVAIALRADYRDPRPFIWLPSEYAAKVWRTYAGTGSMPPLVSDKPIAAIDAFMRPGDEAKGANDALLSVSSGARDGSPTAPVRCGFPGRSALFVTFDRGISSGEAEIADGGAAIDGSPEIWANVMIIRLESSARAGSLKVSLSKIAPADGGPPGAATIDAICE